MLIIILFAFVAGIVTILSPCILPLLPVLLSSTLRVGEKDNSRPYGIVAGFITSFTFFTLFLTIITELLHILANTLRNLSIIIIFLTGLSLLVPELQILSEKLFSRLGKLKINYIGKRQFLGGLLIGVSLGVVWTPCVGPIMATVMSLSLIGKISGNSALITLFYSIGTAVPMFFLIIGGRMAVGKIRWLEKRSAYIQKIFGLLTIATAVLIFFNIDRSFQLLILNKFPNYGSGLTAIESNQLVKNNMIFISDKNKSSSTKAPEIISGGKWFNTGPLSLAGLRGKVVLIDFWTYSCINCIRTLPYLKKWWTDYKDKGLVIIGVHTPEFEFEKDPVNVRLALDDFDIKYPVVQDNSYATWNAYDNQYWPAKYFIDKNGNIRNTSFGEGNYEEDEKIIVGLLAETGEKNLPKTVNDTEYQLYASTPESYLGYNRLDRFYSAEEVALDQYRPYHSRTNLPDNYLSYEGNWKVSPENASPAKGANLLINFSAKNVYLVMNPVQGKTGRIKVSVDGKLQDYGADNKDGIVTVDKDRLYNLVTLETPGRHLLKIEFLDDNVMVFAFTFG